MSILRLYPSWLNAVWYRRAAFESLFRIHSYLPATSTSQRSVATRPPPSSSFVALFVCSILARRRRSSPPPPTSSRPPRKSARPRRSAPSAGRTADGTDDGRTDGPVAGVAVALDSTATDPSVAVVGLRADYCIGLEVGRTEHCMSVLSV